MKPSDKTLEQLCSILSNKFSKLHTEGKINSEEYEDIKNILDLIPSVHVNKETKNNIFKELTKLIALNALKDVVKEKLKDYSFNPDLKEVLDKLKSLVGEMFD